MAKQTLVSQPAEFVLDSIKRSFTRTFWGNIPGDETGKGKMSQTETRDAFLREHGEEAYGIEQTRRTVRIEMDFTGVTVEELIHANTASTTLYKMWYNNTGIAGWSEEAVEAFLRNDCEKDGKTLVHRFTVRDVLDGRTRRVADPSKTRATLAEPAKAMSPDERRAMLEQLAAEMGVKL